MDTTRVREEIYEYLEHADDHFLELIHGMVKANQSKLRGGYKSDFTSITKEEMILRAKESENDISEGRVKTADQIRHDIKGW